MTIDWWTLGLQTVNIAVLVWLLGHFFWRPVATIIRERQIKAQAMLSEAEVKRAEAAAQLTGIEKTRTGIGQEREAIMADVHAAAERARVAAVEQTEQEIAALRAIATVAIEKDKDAAAAVWTDRASRLAVEIARQLAGRLDDKVVRVTFLNWLITAIHGLPDKARRAATADDAVLEVVTAAPLETAEREQCQTQIAEALGGNPQITFKADPALIAGFELHGSHLMISNSWRADLARILADIGHDQEH